MCPTLKIWVSASLKEQCGRNSPEWWSVCFRVSSSTWTVTALWRRAYWRKAERCWPSSPPTNQVQSDIHTFTFVHISTHTHTQVAPTLFHPLLIFGLTMWPSERRTHANATETETRSVKDKEWDGGSDREAERRASGQKVTGRERDSEYSFMCSPTFGARERKTGARTDQRERWLE